MILMDRLRRGDAMHREAADAIVMLEGMSEFVLSDNQRGIDFVAWQRAKQGAAADDEFMLKKARKIATDVLLVYGEFDDAEHHRFLNDGIWNDHPAVQSALVALRENNG